MIPNEEIPKTKADGIYLVQWERLGPEEVEVIGCWVHDSFGFAHNIDFFNPLDWIGPFKKEG